MSETLTVESVRRLEIKPNEVLVVALPADIEPTMFEQARDFLNEALPGAKIVVTNLPLELTVVADERHG